MRCSSTFTEEVWVPAYDPTSGLPQSGGAPGDGDGYYETQNVYTPMTKVGGSNPGEGQYSITGSGTSLAYLFNSADAGKDAKLVYALTVNIATEFTFFPGSRPQSPWAYMLGRHPTRALAYAGTCHVAAEAFQLGSSGTLDNLNFELIGPGVFGGGIQDAGIDQCIHLVTDDPDGGCGFPTALIGDLTAAIAYCASAGIFFSPICDRQQTAASYLQDYCDAANLAVCWNDGLLKFIPYGDTPLAGNGYTYVPDLTPVYDLDDDDFRAGIARVVAGTGALVRSRWQNAIPARDRPYPSLREESSRPALPAMARSFRSASGDEFGAYIFPPLHLFSSSAFTGKSLGAGRAMTRCAALRHAAPLPCGS